MFWHHDDFVEEEWSVSAKVFAGLVFNPFSVVNMREDSLFLWFLHHATRELSLSPPCWSAMTEYRGSLGRNDWRLHVDNWRIAVECKFGDGIDPFDDCLQYLEGSSNHHRVVVVASVSELSELTDTCRASGDEILALKRSIAAGDVRLTAWPEIIDAAIDRLASEQSEILKNWANGTVKNRLELMPSTRISGEEAATLIAQGQSAGISYTHESAWKEGPDVAWRAVYSKRNPPAWVRRCLETAWRAFSERPELKLKRVPSGWADIKRKSLSYSVTLFPWESGLAVIISHPRKASSEYPSFKRLVDLEADGVVPSNKRHFPRDIALGVELLSPVSEHDVVKLISNAVALL